MKKQLKEQKGFTIIEVMIVLVIAAVILLIVFLAVPALQRNARNTQRKEDASNLLAAVNEYMTNNSGKLPTGCSGSANEVVIGTGAGVTTSTGKLGYYTGNCSTTATVGAPAILTAFAVTAPYDSAGEDMLTIVPSAACNGGITKAGSSRQVAAVYEIENGSGSYAPVCQES